MTKRAITYSKRPPLLTKKGTMQIKFNNVLSVEIQGVIKLLTDNGYVIEGARDYEDGLVYDFKL